MDWVMGNSKFNVSTRRKTSFTRLVGNSLPAAVLAKWFPKPEKVKPAMKKANARRASLFLINFTRCLQLVSLQSYFLHEQVSKAHVKSHSHAGLSNRSQACQGLADSKWHYFYNSKWSNRQDFNNVWGNGETSQIGRFIIAGFSDIEFASFPVSSLLFVLLRESIIFR